ncbi:MAG: hypothetical protein ACPGOV_16760 [Magnetovibrionaceae bacterium]
MRRLSLMLFILVLLGVAGGGVFLATWEIPAPTAEVRKVLPDDRFPR